MEHVQIKREMEVMRLKRDYSEKKRESWAAYRSQLEAENREFAEYCRKHDERRKRLCSEVDSLQMQKYDALKNGYANDSERMIELHRAQRYAEIELREIRVDYERRRTAHRQTVGRLFADNSARCAELKLQYENDRVATFERFENEN